MLFLFFLGQVSVMAQKDCMLLPKPQQMETKGGGFLLNQVKISTPVLQAEWEALVAELGGKADKQASRLIEVKIVPAIEGAELNQEEAYRLAVTNKAITVEATTEKGAYWAMQTLRQLASKRNGGAYIKGCRIVDWPAFKIRASPIYAPE